MRNNYLVDHASLLVAWYDGSPGGTRHTVSRALRRGLEFVNLHPQRARSRADRTDAFLTRLLPRHKRLGQIVNNI